MKDNAPSGSPSGLRKFARKVPFARRLVTMYFATLDRKTPLWVKSTVLGAIAYFVLPIDMIPDVILGLGFTDDAAALLAAYKAVSSHVTDEHKEKAKAWLDTPAAPPPS